MQPAVEVAESAPLLTLAWMLLPILLGIAVALTWLGRRVTLAPALSHWVRWLNPLVIVAWLGAGLVLLLLLLSGLSLPQALVRLAIVALLGLLGAPVLRDLGASLVIGLEGRHRLRDDVRVAGLEGRIVSLGLRSVVLRSHDGSEHTIPNHRFVRADVQRLNLASGEAPLELEVVLHRPAGIEATMIELVEAAVLSPLAAPGSLPEVFLVEAEGARLRLRLRVYVFDRAYEERYRSDIIARLGLASAREADASTEPR